MKLILVGAGFFAQFQAEAWHRIPGAELAAVVDSQPAKAAAFAARTGIPRFYESMEEAIQKERPALVDIATRPESHLELVRKAAEAGLHIICQKPMAPSMGECLAMVDAANRAGVRLLIHENWRWQPWFREIKRVLESGDLGRIFQISFFWRTGDGRGPKPYSHQPYFSQMPRLLIYETLVHILDTFRYLLGEVTRVDCQIARVNPVLVGEDQALIHLRFASGALGLIDGNRISGPMPPPVAMGTLLAEGDRGCLRMSADGRLWRCEFDGNETLHPYVIPTEGYRGDSVYATQAHLLNTLSTGCPSESDAADYLKTVELVERCYMSASPA